MPLLFGCYHAFHWTSQKRGFFYDQYAWKESIDTFVWSLSIYFIYFLVFFISYSGGPFSYDLFFVTLRAEGSYQFYVHSFSVIRRVNLKTGVSRKQSAPNILKNKHFLSVYVRIRGYNKRYNPYIFCWKFLLSKEWVVWGVNLHVFMLWHLYIVCKGVSTPNFKFIPPITRIPHIS